MNILSRLSNLKPSISFEGINPFSGEEGFDEEVVEVLL